jgi:glycosyltransferase involved in cell wall biosynthesis
VGCSSEENKMLVSIIIPNYNQTHYISDAIHTALNQTFHSFEIIVVDDGSTDNSHEVVSRFGNQVRYIYQKNQGLAGARNTGIRAATGDFVGLLDADDTWVPDYLERMIALASQYPLATVYYCSAQCMDTSGRELPQILGGPPVPPDQIYHALLRANFLIPSTILMRRSAVIEAGLFDQNLRSCEDWDLWLRISPGQMIVGTSECLVRYRVHGNSLSTNPSGMQQATRKVIEKHFGSDDGLERTWTKEKRRAYGGVYRYHLLTSVQRQNDWQAAANYLCRALQVDPTLSADLDLFYDLALGSQPVGYRGTNDQLNFEGNAQHINTLLNDVFSLDKSLEFRTLRRFTFGTANHALGLLAYNTSQFSLSRYFLMKALKYRPDLIGSTLLMSDLIKSMVSHSIIEKVKKYSLRFHN